MKQLSQESNAEEKEIGGPDFNGKSDAIYPHSKKKKKKNSSSTDTYNLIRAEGKHLATIASSDSQEQFNTLLTLLQYI